MLSEDLHALKVKNNLSVKKIAEMSGVPESTVSRILAGQTTDPGFETVRAIVVAMGGSLDELAGISKREATCAETLREELEKSEKRERKAEIKQYVLFGIILALFTLIIYLILDALHGNWGIFRYQDILQALDRSASAMPSVSSVCM